MIGTGLAIVEDSAIESNEFVEAVEDHRFALAGVIAITNIGDSRRVAAMIIDQFVYFTVKVLATVETIA